MSQAEAGKGSSPRPFSVSEKEYAQKWERIFGKKDVEKIVKEAREYLKEADKEKKDD